MASGPQEVLKISEIAEVLYDFLPANPHPYAQKRISFSGCAFAVGVGEFWRGGSKLPAITSLLRDTITFNRDRFCPLVLEIVNTAIGYRKSKKNPISRVEIEKLNHLIKDVGFKIPELWDTKFLNSLQGDKSEAKVTEKIIKPDFKKLKENCIGLTKLKPHPRGFAFQDFLNEFFLSFGLSPKKPFRLVGEEIDGSVQVDSDTYLVEAKWHSAQLAQRELLVFSGKVGGKSAWSRGLMISYSGFTEDGLEAFARGKSTNIIGMSGQDIFFILEGEMQLKEVIQKKARRAAETNDFFVSVMDL